MFRGRGSSSDQIMGNSIKKASAPTWCDKVLKYAWCYLVIKYLYKHFGFNTQLGNKPPINLYFETKCTKYL